MDMDTRTARPPIRWLAAIAYVVMVAVNALANTLPINGVQTGEVSDAYPNLFAPAPLTFSIWGLIYLLTALYALYQLGLFRGRGTRLPERVLDRVSLYFLISSLANAAWIFAWHYDAIALSMVLMLVILGCLLAILVALRGREMEARERLLVRLPFSVYAGWITVATIANATTLLVNLGWDGFGLSEPVWTVLVLLVGLAIAIATILREADVAYGLVIVWAYTGILIRHTSAGGFAGQYTAVIVTVIVALVALLAACAYVLFARRRGLGYT
jgi:hypothetical protein